MNIFYFDNLNVVGGVETFLYYVAKKYCKRDITVYYKEADKGQLRRLKKYVRVKKYSGEIIKCKKAFFNYNPSIIDNVEAEEYIQVIHLDYKLQGVEPKLNPKITRYIGVSKAVAKHFEELTGIKAEVVYNPIAVDEEGRVLKLVSATRLTPEKGKARMERLGNLLNMLGIPYIWLIFTDDINAIDNPNMIYMKPRLDIASYIKEADFLVQLSTSEAYCFSVVESLVLKTPVIVTDLEVYKEIGLDDNNSIRLDLDFKEIDLNRLLKTYDFKYTPKKDGWDKLLDNTKSTYKEDTIKDVRVKCTFFLGMDLIEENCHVNEGETLYVTKDRAEELLRTGCFEVEKEANN